jgi:hypothetical protein
MPDKNMFRVEINPKANHASQAAYQNLGHYPQLEKPSLNTFLLSKPHAQVTSYLTVNQTQS